MWAAENEDILDINDLEISPSNPESVVIVEPDDGITSVNALTKLLIKWRCNIYIAS